mgnify:CR=1 FL=1
MERLFLSWDVATCLWDEVPKSLKARHECNCRHFRLGGVSFEIEDLNKPVKVLKNRRREEISTFSIAPFIFFFFFSTPLMNDIGNYRLEKNELATVRSRGAFAL